MIDYQKINELYKKYEDKPFQNKELISLFEASFKEALKQESLNDIKALFHYDYSYKMLENIYQQFKINDDVMELILPIKNKKIIQTLYNLCPRLTSEVFAYMLYHDSIEAYQFLSWHDPKNISIEQMINLENVQQMTIKEVKQVLKYFIDYDLTLKHNQNNITCLLNYLVLAKNVDMLNYALHAQKKYLVNYLKHYDIDNDIYFKNAIMKSYTEVPHTACTWIHFAFSDDKLKVIQNKIEQHMLHSPQNDKYASIYETVEQTFKSYIEKRNLEDVLYDVKKTESNLSHKNKIKNKKI